VKAVVYEVTTGNSEGSAFGLALNVLGGKLGLSIGGASTLANSVSIKSASIDSAFSALSGDTRFKAISTPQVRVKSGTQARLLSARTCLHSVLFPILKTALNPFNPSSIDLPVSF
jgi:type II secretory pathway component GspD/PulD (secretin)